MPDCSAIRDELTGLKQERADLQDELRPFPEINLATKAQIIAGIKKLNVKIAEKEKELDNCLGMR